MQNCIEDMMGQFTLLDTYKHKIDFDLGTQVWNVFGSPTKVASKCLEVAESNIAVKKRFYDEMMGEQNSFNKTLADLDAQVSVSSVSRYISSVSRYIYYYYY
jgi:hypothetical protein